MIKEITSVADLIFKAKTQKSYRDLLCIFVAYNWSSYGSVSYEAALELLDKHTSGLVDCSYLVSCMNKYQYRSQVIDSERDEELSRLFELKRRTQTAADDARPSMRFNGENLTINNSYQLSAQEYDRLRRDANPHNVRSNSYQPSATERPERIETIERTGLNPYTQQRHTICRRIPANLPNNIRAEIEEEVVSELNNLLLRPPRVNSNNNSYSDCIDDLDDYNPYDDAPFRFIERRRTNEDNPNNDR